MGAEWCMDYVKGSLLNDETASLPGRVQADHTLTQLGRRSTYALFCFASTLSVCEKCFGVVIIQYRGQHIWQSLRYPLAELWLDRRKHNCYCFFPPWAFDNKKHTWGLFLPVSSIIAEPWPYRGNKSCMHSQGYLDATSDKPPSPKTCMFAPPTNPRLSIET